jgi:hypothetical protein
VVGETVEYLKAALLATLTAILTLVVVVAVQVWLSGLMFEREVRAEIDASSGGGGGVYAAVQDNDLLPAFVLAVGAFLGMFVWRLRAGRAPSPESRVPGPEPRVPSPEPRG